MNPPVTTQFAMPDPSASPLNLIQLFQLANALVSSQIQGSYIPYVMGSTTPGVDDQDKAWLELDASGRPKSIKIFYNGHWRRVYNGMLGEVRGFTGDPGYGPPPKNFDVNGLGNVGGDYDGWGICNGKGGRPDWSNQFVCGANMNPAPGKPSGYDNGWQTLIEPGDIIANPGGGGWTTEIKLENLPLPLLSQTNMDRYSINGNPGEFIDPNGLLWGLDQGHTSSRRPIPSGNPPDLNYVYPPGGPNPSPPTGLFVGPPFKSLAWIIFVGYA